MPGNLKQKQIKKKELLISNYLADFQSVLADNNELRQQLQVEDLENLLKNKNQQKKPFQQIKIMFKQQKNQLSKKQKLLKLSHIKSQSDSTKAETKSSSRNIKNKKSLSQIKNSNIFTKLKTQRSQNNKQYADKLNSQIQYFGKVHHHSKNKCLRKQKSWNKIDILTKKGQIKFKQQISLPYAQYNQIKNISPKLNAHKINMQNKMKTYVNKIIQIDNNQLNQINKIENLSQKERKRLLKIHMIQKQSLKQEMRKTMKFYGILFLQKQRNSPDNF